MKLIDVSGSREVMGGKPPISRLGVVRDEPVESHDLGLAVVAPEPGFEEFLDERVISTPAAVRVGSAPEQAHPLGFGHEPARLEVIGLARHGGELRVDRLEEGDS